MSTPTIARGHLDRRATGGALREALQGLRSSPDRLLDWLAGVDAVAHLICIQGPGRGALFTLQGIPTRIGRAETCPIRLFDERVSREHAEIEATPEGYRIRDLESRNGIEVNGLPTSEGDLRPGDEIRIGGTVLLLAGDGSEGPREGVWSGATVVNDPARAAHSLRRSSLPGVRSTPLVGESPLMAEVYRRVAVGARTDLPVLILGESGTGKELIARALHSNSSRRDQPFIPVNCANLTSTLLESELFGHEKGAFTGADERRVGLFEATGSGTMFLDEIGEIEPGLQARLLRVLAEKEFTRVGGHLPIPTEARIVAATHRNLRLEIEANRFREDLFYRLNVLPIEVPPLRARPEDVPLLVRHFLDRARKESATRVRDLSGAAMQAMQSYSWPGNVRELRNVIERLSIFCPGETAELADLPVEIRAPEVHLAASARPPRVLDDVERECILHALHVAEGNKSVAARLLGIERSTLYSKLKRHRIETAAPAEGPS